MRFLTLPDAEKPHPSGHGHPKSRWRATLGVAQRLRHLDFGLAHLWFGVGAGLPALQYRRQNHRIDLRRAPRDARRALFAAQFGHRNRAPADGGDAVSQRVRGRLRPRLHPTRRRSITATLRRAVSAPGQRNSSRAISAARRRKLRLRRAANTLRFPCYLRLEPMQLRQPLPATTTAQARPSSMTWS